MDTLHVEPAAEKRPAFALWCISQTPSIQTASATGYDIPVPLFQVMPTELLEDAYVDGFLFAPQTAAQPVIEDTDSTKAPQAVSGPPTAPDGAAPRRTRKARKTASRPPAEAPDRKDDGDDIVALVADADGDL